MKLRSVYQWPGRLLALMGILLPMCCLTASAMPPDAPHAVAEQSSMSGIVFDCPGSDLEALSRNTDSYFKSLGISPSTYTVQRNPALGQLSFQLADHRGGTDTLELIDLPEFNLREEVVKLPSQHKSKSVVTVSRKEIVLAMMQRGRQTKFAGRACTVDALKDQVGVRQNIVAWTESAEWAWVDGRHARWNDKYWVAGNYKSKYPLQEALSNIFVQPDRYFFGCYTATKLLIAHAMLDYYQRIKHDKTTTEFLIRRLLTDKDPLSTIEPGNMWSFEADYDAMTSSPVGKLIHLTGPVPHDNFIPGDWVYFVNPDHVSARKNGYEGANAIYLGRGLFSDYYNDNHHRFTFREQLDEVYQWRHGVFNRPRDNHKIQPLSAVELDALSRSITQGGLQLDYRGVPYDFGYVALPRVQGSASGAAHGR